MARRRTRKEGYDHEETDRHSADGGTPRGPDGRLGGRARRLLRPRGPRRGWILRGTGGRGHPWHRPLARLRAGLRARAAALLRPPPPAGLGARARCGAVWKGGGGRGEGGRYSGNGDDDDDYDDGSSRSRRVWVPGRYEEFRTRVWMPGHWEERG